MKVHMQPWYDRWLKEAREAAGIPKDSDPNGGPSLEQVHFVRDNLCSMLWSDIKYDKRPKSIPREDCNETCFVIGEHTSKSRRLPVYSLERPDLGIQFVLNYNYHFWQCSVLTEKPLTDGLLTGFELDFSKSEKEKRGIWREGESWGYCAFQGFPDGVKFGPYSQNRKRFSLTMGTEYSVYTFVWLIMRDIRGVGPWSE